MEKDKKAKDKNLSTFAKTHYGDNPAGKMNPKTQFS
jgi:hypothetical protein